VRRFRLASWQRSTLKLVVLHHAYIAGENDDEGDVNRLWPLPRDTGPAQLPACRAMRAQAVG